MAQNGGGAFLALKLTEGRGVRISTRILIGFALLEQKNP
jgi:hypothetical protein